ncbi:MAG TPA: carboxypeptidase-like regulatory domain-containing protein, partial [Blastocatellia bacterium]|nr:carboxypeptidase-like regulatory domain-containing protein [Blastocatellia bacterium]
MPNPGGRTGRIRRAVTLLFMAAICCPAAADVAAQTNTAALEGVVKDSVGAIVPDALVTVVHVASGLTQERKTDGTGSFLFPSLPVGEYTITVERAGFKRGVRNGLVLELGQTAKVEIVLQAGDIAEQVTIASGEPLMKTSSAEISDVIENNRIVQLPLNGRQFLQLA